MSGLGPRLDVGRLERGLLARMGRREGGEIRFLCPAHDDSRPSARWSQVKSVWYCDVCHQGGGWLDLSRRLGIEPAGAGGGGAATTAERGAGRAPREANGLRREPRQEQRREPLREPRREVVATYRYTDAAGRLLYEVLRLRPKAFSCRRPARDGDGWLWNLQDVERVLYRLPEVAAAVEREELVFLVEGEQDADALAALGFTATTHCGGADRWRPAYGEALRGGRVVVVPDNDEVGRRHAETVIAGLVDQAAEVRRLDLPGLPAKGDASDWLAARAGEGLSRDTIRCRFLDLALAAPRVASGVTPAGAERAAALAAVQAAVAGPAAVLAAAAAPGLVPAAAAAPAIVPAAPAAAAPAVELVRCLADIPPEPVSFLWEPYLPIGKLTLLEGDPGQGKSWVTAAIAAAGSRGRGLPGAAAFAPFRTLFLTAEDGLPDTLRPRLESLGADCGAVFACEQPLSLGVDADLATLGQALERYRPRLLVVDPLVAFLGRGTDIYRANEVRSVLAPLVKLVERHACALLAVRHLNKAKLGRALYAGQGSIDFTAAARSVLLAGSADDEGTAHALLHIKSNLAPHGEGLAYRLLPAFTWQGPSRLTADDLLAAAAPGDEAGAMDDARAFLRATLAGGEPLPSREILQAARDAGVSLRTLRRARRKEGVRASRRGFGTGSTWLWALPALPATEAGQAEGEGGHTKAWPPSVGEGVDGLDGAAAGRRTRGGGGGSAAEEEAAAATTAETAAGYAGRVEAGAAGGEEAESFATAAACGDEGGRLGDSWSIAASDELDGLAGGEIPGPSLTAGFDDDNASNPGKKDLP